MTGDDPTPGARPLYYILDAHGEPVPCDDALTWGHWLETSGDARIVARDRDEGRPDGADVEVSTVFVGLDFGWGDGPPLLYESMIFGGPLDGEKQRYATRADALVGHQRMCRRVRGGADPNDA